MPSQGKVFERDFPAGPAVRGFWHEPSKGWKNALVFTHGAGSNCEAPLCVVIAEEFAAAGIAVLRCDLPYRQKRPKGAPFPAGAAEDREGLQRAVSAVREKAGGRVFLGGQSYGGRQATMVAAENDGLADALLLTSYPLHPPGQPNQLRTAHFTKLQTPALFAHGSKDPFGTLEEMRESLVQIPAPTALLEFEGGVHGLVQKQDGTAAFKAMAIRVREAFEEFTSSLA
ncbi:MAG TPA: alpha/beta fold hydrolase [Terriglobales bacterium]